MAVVKIPTPSPVSVDNLGVTVPFEQEEIDQATVVELEDGGVEVDAVVEISVDDSEIIRRMSGRRVHLASGRTYHVVFNPPKQEGKDDITGEPLIQRDDDKEETVRKRLEVYHSQTEPLIDYYKNWESSGEAGAPKYIRIEGVGKVAEIRDQIFAALDRLS